MLLLFTSQIYFLEFFTFFLTFISKRCCLIVVMLFEGFFASTTVILNWIISNLLTCVRYSKHSDKHYWLIKQLDFSWQLHSFSVIDVGSFNKLVLWFWITLTTFCIQFDVMSSIWFMWVWVMEACEVVVQCALDILRKEFGDNKFGFSRDDGLSCFQDLKVLKDKKTLHDLQITLVKYHCRM